jgi:hypothetical protein
MQVKRCTKSYFMLVSERAGQTLIAMSICDDAQI